MWHIGFALRDRAWARALAWVSAIGCGMVTGLYTGVLLFRRSQYDFSNLFMVAYMAILKLWLSDLAKGARHSLRRWLRGAWTGQTRTRVTWARGGDSTYELANMAQD